MESTLPPIKTVEEICAMPRGQIETDLRTVQARLQSVTAERERLANQLQTTTEEETRLVMQSQWIAMALRLHQQSDTGLPGAAAALRASIDAAPRRQEQNISANVLTIVRNAGGGAVTPQQVHERLGQLGIETSERVIRTALRRWAKRGALVKDGFVYRALPPSRPRH